MSFKDIKGNSRTIELLKSGIIQDTLFGAYIFSGPDGIGKMLAAKTLAKALNCQENNSDACGICPSCSRIDKGVHPDISIIDALGSEIKIDYIRQLQRDISLRPYEARKKVFIINNAHDLNPESSNAFLKTLEEPPKNSLIILVSAKPSLLFKTILSRSKIIRFYPLKRQELKEALINDYGLDAQTGHFLAYYSEGSIGKALYLKDRDILREKNQVIDDLFSAEAGSAGNHSENKREDIRRSLDILAGWIRDIYLVKSGQPQEEMIHLDRKSDILRLANHYSFFDLDVILKAVSDSLLYLGQNVNTKLLLANLQFSLKS
ncbi:MAG: DNA polymerase III subunit delta' [Candidatus Omnitrophota bacterium]|nr:DNA polymerase III subunit delta' [Candidatus Omnitrophota bacterium]MBU1928597.1 DNA polymerase III subunit delta' [Candidatus Omnitrophota bacterium]MBU2034610.1 DNA polymerase III subunit delta' [Candidatus Omnitrophota bacterium]MBU2221135.1 DNA polymerase III subunit delta' [Candidatus Omnitrophota bacterium]